MLVKKANSRPTKKEERYIHLLLTGQRFATQLIKRATPYELNLKSKLEKVGEGFIFQHPVVVNFKYLYILDFYFPDLNLVIELNSKQWHTKPAHVKADKLRQRRLKKAGIKMIILWNSQISTITSENLKKILETYKQPY